MPTFWDLILPNFQAKEAEKSGVTVGKMPWWLQAKLS